VSRLQMEELYLSSGLMTDGSALPPVVISYEFDRGSMNLTFAGTIMKAGVATITIGSGRCTVGPQAR
jgi:hypothetical protein